VFAAERGGLCSSRGTETAPLRGFFTSEISIPWVPSVSPPLNLSLQRSVKLAFGIIDDKGQ
jgi:hypothetical protein